MSPQQLPRADPCTGTLQCVFKVSKSDEDERLVFGWASVASRSDGKQVVDWQDDVIEIDELERAAYEYVLLFGEAGEMHERGGVGTLVESMVFTKSKTRALGIPDGILPEGWWTGFKITDDDVWRKIKDGTYRSFSIEGTAVRERVDET